MNFRPPNNLLPPLEPAEYEALKESIATNGYWAATPVVVDETGAILDGFNRAAICKELGIKYPTVVMAGLTPWEKIDYSVRSNVTRRHLSAAQRRQLLKRLVEELDKDLRAKGKAAQSAGGKGGKVVKNETSLALPTEDARARNAAADASETRFDAPVVAKPAEKVDRLQTLGTLVGASRSTVAKDQAITAREEAIDKAATKQKRTDVLRLLNGPRPKLDELERAVGLRAPLPDLPAGPDASERLGWVRTLATALDHLAPALSTEEAGELLDAVTDPAALIVQIGQLRGAVASAKSERKG